MDRRCGSRLFVLLVPLCVMAVWSLPVGVVAQDEMGSALVDLVEQPDVLGDASHEPTAQHDEAAAPLDPTGADPGAVPPDGGADATAAGEALPDGIDGPVPPEVRLLGPTPANVLSASLSKGKARHVPSALYPTIQSAINAADDGDNVIVAPGLYRERLSWHDKALFLLGASPELTVVDAEYLGPCLAVLNVPNRSKVGGFTFTQGKAVYVGTGGASGIYGGGLVLMNSPIAVTGNRIVNCTSDYAGGGIALLFSEATLKENVITGNYARFGGGVCAHSSAAVVKGNRIEANRSGYQGGGLNLWYSAADIRDNQVRNNTSAVLAAGAFVGASSATLRDNEITENSAETYGGGGVLINTDPSPAGSPPADIRANVISRNTAAHRGGGVALYFSSAEFRDNEVADNTAADGGGFYVYQCSPLLEANTISGNAVFTSFGGGVLAWGGSSAVTAPRIVGNRITGNSAYVGGAVYGMSASPQVIGNLLSGNATVNGGAAWVYSYSPGLEPLLEANEIAGNTASGRGGGVTPSVTVGTVRRNTVSGNVAGEYGGGVYVYECSPRLEANLVAGNSSGYGGGLAVYRESTHTSTVTAPELLSNDVNGNAATQDGGGVYAYYASPQIVGNVISANTARNGGGAGAFFGGPGAQLLLEENEISGNTATWQGAGVCLTASPGIFRGNTVTGNASTAAGARGGGAYLYECSPRLEANLFAGNASGYGGGVAVYRDPSHTSAAAAPLLLANEISGNSALYNGGGLFAYYASPNAVGNRISANAAGYYGGGLYAYAYSPGVWPVYDANHILANTAAISVGGGYIGGSTSSAPAYAYALLRNNLVAGNTAASVGGLYLLYPYYVSMANCTVSGNSGQGVYRYGGSYAWIYNCILWGNAGTDLTNCTAYYSDVGTGGSLGAGSFRADPLLVGLGDFHLQVGSPCIDAGNNAPPPYGTLPATDLDGNPRLVNGVVDMGAYEWQGP